MSQNQIYIDSCKRYSIDCVEVNGYPFTVALSGEDGHQQILYPYLSSYSDDGKVTFHLQPEHAAQALTIEMPYSAGWSQLQLSLLDIEEGIAQGEAEVKMLSPLRLYSSSRMDPNYQWLSWMFLWPLWLALLVLWAAIMELVYWLRKRRT